MVRRTSPEALDETVIRQFFVPYSNLKIVKNVLSGPQPKKKMKERKLKVLEASTHRRHTSTIVLYIYRLCDVYNVDVAWS